MSSLRQCLRNPKTWLAFFGVLLVLAGLDTCRSPADQVTASVYVGGVRVYQALGRPLLKDHVRCRYEPTCSEYSIEAVRTHGIRRGLVLTYNRISSCTADVPIGTYDPVPCADDDCASGSP